MALSEVRNYSFSRQKPTHARAGPTVCAGEAAKDQQLLLGP